MLRFFLNFLFLGFLSASDLAVGRELEQLLQDDAAPPGVVIEILTSDASGLEWALPRAGEAIRQLRQRFPALPVAIVSHGREEFALTRSQAGKHLAAHQLVKQLKRDDDVQLHVCGAHAEMFKISSEDFPEYVDVSASGPAQINDYKALGYEELLIDAR